MQVAAGSDSVSVSPLAQLHTIVCGAAARGGGRGRTDVGIVLGGGMYRKMATEATAMGEAMEAMATGEARRVMMTGTARATATATTKTAVLPAKML